MSSSPIANDSDYYTKAYECVRKRIRNEDIVHWLDEGFRGDIVEAKLTQSFSTDATIRMLGVGSGSGETDVKLATGIRSRFKNVHNTVLEPAAEQQDLYRALIDTYPDKDGLDGIEFDFRQETMDGYRNKLTETGGELPKFHFISALHSLYYVDDLADTVGYLYNRLEEGGVMLLTVASDKGGFWPFWTRFPTLASHKELFSNIQLREALEASANSIAYEETNRTSFIDISDCFEEDSADGKMMMDFFTHTLDFRGTTPPELFREVTAYLRSENCSDRGEDGAVMLRSDSACFMAQQLLTKS